MCGIVGILGREPVAIPLVEALRRLIGHDVRYHSQHPELVRLVMNENIHRAEHLKQIEALPEANQQVIAILGGIIARGEAAMCWSGPGSAWRRRPSAPNRWSSTWPTSPVRFAPEPAQLRRAGRSHAPIAAVPVKFAPRNVPCSAR